MNFRNVVHKRDSLVIFVKMTDTNF